MVSTDEFLVITESFVIKGVAPLHLGAGKGELIDR